MNELSRISSCIKIIYETPSYVVIDKPTLLDVQSSRANRPSVAGWLKNKFKFSGLVHRLDFGTSGLMVCAKNSKAAAHLTQLLQQGKIKRHYLALVLGRGLAASGLSDKGLFQDPINNQTAVTYFQVKERYPNAMLLELSLETGRKHQIRQHLAEAGYPILGDHLYGKRGAKQLHFRPALHAHKLTIENKHYQSKLPQDMHDLIKKLKNTRN